MRLLRRLLGGGAPEELAGALAAGEHVVGSAPVDGGGLVAVTPLGLWVPAGEGFRRIGWHLVSKAVWRDAVLEVTEAEEVGSAGEAVLLADTAPVRFRLSRPGALPKQVQQRVDGSIRSRHREELPGGGAWFVVRKVPGQDGAVLQVRADPGVDTDLVAGIAADAAAKLAT
ncbi:hypothetical protein [Amycolatopsis cihanbeyliensis]|uniref:Uncharacterized protein n=1 Tax=Amycolatopsis cihanbeyliensis TaxID=1128664 RepID=A0A542CTG1_AMYCI|nr:hypothetical protein [Amycolatopsis cihanbeyliensis]TQI94109.1 hypothetical protein FB471_6264 [Amycolatopsis cihanbeyliensis]